MKQPIYIFIFLAFPFGLLAQSQAKVTIDYINKYKGIAISEMNRTGIPASITLAQAIVESGSGESLLAKKANNHFLIYTIIYMYYPKENTKNDDIFHHF